MLLLLCFYFAAVEYFDVAAAQFVAAVAHFVAAYIADVVVGLQ